MLLPDINTSYCHGYCMCLSSFCGKVRPALWISINYEYDTGSTNRVPQDREAHAMILFIYLAMKKVMSYIRKCFPSMDAHGKTTASRNHIRRSKKRPQKLQHFHALILVTFHLCQKTKGKM